MPAQVILQAGVLAGKWPSDAIRVDAMLVGDAEQESDGRPEGGDLAARPVAGTQDSLAPAVARADDGDADMPVAQRAGQQRGEIILGLRLRRPLFPA